MNEFCGFKVEDSEELGRYVIATRLFRIGDLILQEEPLVVSSPPKPISLSAPNLSKEINVSSFDCVGCYKSLAFKEVQYCLRCKFPVCSQHCVKESLHAKYECSLFEEKKIDVSAEVYSLMSILRGVLMYQDEDQTNWLQLSSLCSDYSLSQEDCVAKRLEEIEEVTHFFKERFQINIDAKIVGQLIGIFKINAFGIDGEGQDGSSYRAIAVYNRGSMFAHDCAPNAESIVLPTDCNGIPRWHLLIYARKNIVCDEAINISYLSDCFQTDRITRRKSIAERLSFDCKCSRCTDASEFSFYTEAIKCSSCGVETLTADSLTDELCSWTCNNCGVVKPFSFAKDCVDHFYGYFRFIWKCRSEIALDLLINSANRKFGLGQNHRDVILSMFEWLQLNRVEYIEQLCEHLRRIDDMFVIFMTALTKCVKVLRMFGGVMADIVELESWFARAIGAYYFKKDDFQSIGFDPYLPEEKLEILTAICAHLKIAHDTMQWYPINYLPKQFRRELMNGYKFWNHELDYVKDMLSTDMRYSSDDLNGVGVKVINQVAELKSSPNELSDPLTKDVPEEAFSEVLKETMEIVDNKVAVRLSSQALPYDVINFSGDSNLILIKPQLSLLKEYDFYFN